MSRTVEQINNDIRRDRAEVRLQKKNGITDHGTLYRIQTLRQELKLAEYADVRRARTQTIIDNFRGNSDEWGMLKGLLCMDHGFSFNESQPFRELIDTGLIAERMDEINKQARDSYLASVAK